ncbi:AbrB/MazE/SpoVT family DNA-binding domain-containing protein [Nanoarchaeota archaeon]
MKRKVVKHGPSTFIISLPSKWIKKYGIEKGDELDVDEQGDTVIISTKEGQKVGQVEVDVSELDRTSLLFLIRSLYKLGYQEIKLNFKNQSALHHRLGKERTVISVVHEEVNRLTGMEVVQQRENFCIIKALSVMSFSEFEPVLRRIFRLLIDASEDLIKGADKRDETLLNTIEEKHNSITKFISFCLRVLSLKGYPDSKKKLNIHQIISMTDKVLDTIKNTSRNLIYLKPLLSGRAKEFMESIHRLIVIYYELFYKFEKEKILKIFELRDKIYKEIKDDYKKLSKEELVVVNQLSGIVDLIVDMTESRMALEY